MNSMENNNLTEVIELLSTCCGAQEDEYAEGFCVACREATTFEEVLSLVE